MTDDQFTNLFKYIEKMRAEMNARFDTHDQRFDKVDTTLDGIAKRLDTDEAERAAIYRQLNRQQRWIEKLARHQNIHLDYQEE